MVAQSTEKKPKRVLGPVDYNEVNPLMDHELKWTHLLSSREFQPHSFQIMQGNDVTAQWAKETGFRDPIIILEPDGLGLTMPPHELTVRQVAEACGLERTVQVLQGNSCANL